MELTVRTIALAIERYSATREVIVSGGGAHNIYLMERLRSCFEAASHNIGGIWNRRGCERGHPVRGAGVRNISPSRGQSAIRHGSAETSDSRQDFAALKHGTNPTADAFMMMDEVMQCSVPSVVSS